MIKIMNILAVVQQPATANKVMNGLILGAIVAVIILVAITLFSKK